MSISSEPSGGQFPERIGPDIPIVLVEEIPTQDELMRRLTLFQNIVDQLKQERDMLYNDNTCYRQALEESEEQVANLAAERDVYKERYEQALTSTGTQNHSREYSELEQENQELREQLALKDQVIARNHEESDAEISRLRAEVERLDQTTHRYEMDRLYQRDLNRVPQKQLSPVDKDILAEIRQYNRTLQNDPYAPNRICIGVLSNNLGVSDSTVARRIDDLAANGLIQKTTTDPTKADPKTHVDVALTPMLDNPIEIRRFVERNIGGDRMCRKCGHKTNRYIIEACSNCGDVDIRDLPGNSISYQDQENFTVVIAGQENVKQTKLDLDQLIEATDAQLDQVTQSSPVPAAPGDDLAAAQQVLEKVMKNYHVEFRQNYTCQCGCQLWHRDVGGDLVCCRCEPIAIWPNSYDEALHLLFPTSRTARAGSPTS